MLITKLLLLLTFNNQGVNNVGMDGETLFDDEIATLTYILGCGDWENFSFTTSGNLISATAAVQDSWFNCNIDPAPPQFWNRLPLTQLSAGNYDLTLTLNSPTQSTVGQLNFTIAAGIQPQAVPVNNLAALLLLALLVLLIASTRQRTVGSLG